MLYYNGEQGATMSQSTAHNLLLQVALGDCVTKRIKMECKVPIDTMSHQKVTCAHNLLLQVALGDCVTKRIKMECKVPIEFEYEVKVLQPNPAFKVR